MNTKLEKLLNRVDELDRGATPEKWDYYNHQRMQDNEELVCFEMLAMAKHPASQPVIEYWGDGKLIAAIADLTLIVQYRTLAPLLAKQLKVAVEALQKNADEDYRGNRSVESVRSFMALQQIEDLIND